MNLLFYIIITILLLIITLLLGFITYTIFNLSNIITHPFTLDSKKKGDTFNYDWLNDKSRW